MISKTELLNRIKSLEKRYEEEHEALKCVLKNVKIKAIESKAWETPYGIVTYITYVYGGELYKSKSFSDFAEIVKETDDYIVIKDLKMQGYGYFMLEKRTGTVIDATAFYKEEEKEEEGEKE